MSDSNSSNWAARARRNTGRLAVWTGAWVVTLAVAVFGPTLVWDSQGLSMTAIVVNLVAGVGMIVANKTYLDGLDELQRKIQLEATALALGVGLVAGLAYSTLDITNLISSDAEISYLVMLIGLTYLGGVIAGRRKYQ